MANDLEVNRGGLKAGPVKRLAMPPGNSPAGSAGSPSHAGVSVVDAAVSAARGRQSGRVWAPDRGVQC